MRAWPNALCLLLACTLTACGDDDGGGHATTTGDRSDAATPDGGSMDAQVGSGDSGHPDTSDLRDAGNAGDDDPGKDAGRDGSLAVNEDAGAPDCEQDCAALADACNVAVCNPETHECDVTPRPDGSACGDPTLSNCSAPDRCMAGVCQPRHAAKGTPCGDQGLDCRNDDECDGNGQCVDNGVWAQGTSCGDGADHGVCDAPDTCDDAGNCRDNIADVGVVCADGDNPCRFPDTCDGLGACLDNGNKTAGTACGGADEPNIGTTCHPVADLCDANGMCVNQDPPDGSSCGSATDTECDHPDSCLAGVCVKNREAIGVACGSATPSDPSHPECDLPDSCDGQGACVPNYADTDVECEAATECTYDRRCDGAGGCSPLVHKPTTTFCGSPQPDCYLAQRCDGSGSCLPPQLAPAGTACGDPTDRGVCDAPDLCDGSGSCLPNYAGSGTVCGDDNDACLVDDTCDGAGSCVDNGPEPKGTACGDQSATECDLADVCDGSGQCTPNYASAGTSCGGMPATCMLPDSCDGAGQCGPGMLDVGCTVQAGGRVVDSDTGNAVAGATVQLVGSSPLQSTTSASDGSFVLDVPVGQDFLLHVLPQSAVWGRLEAFRIDDPASTVLSDLAMTDDASLVAGIAVSGLADPDPMNSLFAAYFVGAGGGEGVSLDDVSCSPSECGPIAPDGSGGWVVSDTLVAGGSQAYMLMLNLTPGATTGVSAFGMSGSTACSLWNDQIVDWPLPAHTVVVAGVECVPEP